MQKKTKGVHTSSIKRSYTYGNLYFIRCRHFVPRKKIYKNFLQIFLNNNTKKMYGLFFVVECVVLLEPPKVKILYVYQQTVTILI